jgi:hypothetical protein
MVGIGHQQIKVWRNLEHDNALDLASNDGAILERLQAKDLAAVGKLEDTCKTVSTAPSEWILLAWNKIDFGSRQATHDQGKSLRRISDSTQANQNLEANVRATPSEGGVV